MRFDTKWFLLLVAVIGTRCEEKSRNDYEYDKTRGMCGNLLVVLLNRCRVMRSCYAQMLNELREKDEERCLEPVEICTSTITVYLKALVQYCGHIVNVTTYKMTHESRYLYEVHLHEPKENGIIDYENKPLILIEAGQDAGMEPVKTAMRVIEHFSACQEHEQLLQNFRWVILPCVNPDGLEYVRFDRPNWIKNTRNTGSMSHGVDITRNFDIHWSECPKNVNGFSPRYPGPEPCSEAETKFVKDVIAKHKKYIKAYLSFRRDGHAILYPHAYAAETDDIPSRTIRVAELISEKVNQRSGSRQGFLNASIYDWVGEPTCGNSVDYVFNLGIEKAYEFRVGFGKEIQIVERFQKLEPEYHRQLMSSYFGGIRLLSNLVAEDFEAKKKQIDLTD